MEITGQPNDFNIDFTTDRKTKGLFSPSMIIAYLSSALGGGSIFLSEVKLRETLGKLEKEFWNHVDKQIAELTNSAK